jgi:hypothetical protein
MRRSKQTPEQTYRHPQKQEDHREGCERRGEGEKRNEERTTSKVERIGLPIPPVKTVEFALSVAVTPCVRPATRPPQ